MWRLAYFRLEVAAPALVVELVPAGGQRAPAGDRLEADHAVHLGETGPLSQGIQARRTAIRIRHINGMEVRKKRPRGFKKRPRGFK